MRTKKLTLNAACSLERRKGKGRAPGWGMSAASPDPIRRNSRERHRTGPDGSAGCPHPRPRRPGPAAAVVPGYAIGQPEGHVFPFLSPSLPMPQEQARPGGGMVDAAASALSADIGLKLWRSLPDRAAGRPMRPNRPRRMRVRMFRPVVRFSADVVQALPEGNRLIRKAVSIEHGGLLLSGESVRLKIIPGTVNAA